MTNIPTANTVEVTPNRSRPGAYVLTVICPYCTETHKHGVTSLDPDGGHRVSDCRSRAAQQRSSKGYFVHIPETFRSQHP